jgi:glycosyltransferase involved in cell wall biosynthesis
MAVWAPVDHYPIPAPVLAVLLNEKVKPIAMSRFGENLMREADLNPLYVPHGVDTALFRPRPEIKDEVRDTLGIPRNAFLVAMVGANKSSSPSRKSFPEAFAAFATFAAKHRDAWLYVHSQRDGIGGGHGIDLEMLAVSVGLDAERVRFPDDKAWQLGIGRSTLAKLYQAFDVLLMPSMGEGFGVPIIEAQACGVPVITSNHSAMPELTHAGWLVDGQQYYDHIPAAFFFMPFIHSIANALEAAYDSRGDKTLRAAAAEFALQYDADLVTVQHWAPALEQLGAKPESRQVRRARERQVAKRQPAKAMA